jgi:site-specific DNA recombinase
MAKRAVICARVSTDQQAERGRSLPSQLAEMRSYAQVHGIEVADDPASLWDEALVKRVFQVDGKQADEILGWIRGKAYFVDDISGITPIRQRPGGAQLYHFIDQQAADVVIFHTVDRITRDEDLIEINVIRRDVRNAGMELHYAADGGKTNLSTMGGMIDTLKAAVAAEERKKIIERNMRGRMAKAQAGKWVGEGHPSFGYRKVGKLKDAVLEIDPNKADIVRRIFALYLGSDGNPPMSIRAISELLSGEGIPTPQHGLYWCKRTINFVLRNTSYIGRFPYRGIEISLPHLALIDEATFEAVQARMQKNRECHVHNRVNEYLLTGRIRCTCGRAMSGRLKQGKYLYYVCSSMFLPKTIRTCHEPHVRADTLDAQVWDWLTTWLSDDAQVTAGLDALAARYADDSTPTQSRIAEVDGLIDRAERKLKRLVATYGDAEGAELHALRDEAKQTSKAVSALQAERTRLQKALAAVVPLAGQRAALLGMVNELRQGIAEADFDTRRYALEQLNLSCKIQRQDDDYLASVRCGLELGLSEDGVGNVLHTKTTDPQTAPPAKPGRCCDNRPAPRNRGDLLR